MTCSVLDRVDRGGTHVALRCDDDDLTWDALRHASAHVAKSLGTGKRPVAILAPSSLEFATALVGTWRAGAIAVPLQPAYPDAELAYVLDDTKATELLVHPSLVGRAESLAGTRRIRLHRIDVRPTEPIAFDAPRAAPDDGALLVYTSGTTARPKGVLSTVASLDAQIRMLLDAWGWTECDRTLDVLPLHHVHGLVNVLACSLAAGAACELAAKFDPAHVWSRIGEGRLDVFMAVPTVYAKLVAHWEAQDDPTRLAWSAAAHTLRLMVSGSAALPVPLFERWRAITGHVLLERYGMTELGMALSNPYEGVRRAGTVGIPLPGVEVRLVEADGSERVIEGAGPGELQVRGPTVFREYWGRPEATRDAFTADGWFRTGDVAERDRSGYFRILGRASQDIIKSAGFKISALEIESALLGHPGIAEAAVVGVPDATWGERVAAACVSRNGVPEPAALKSFLAERLAHQKLPTLWHWVDALPRNAMGKVTKPQVREWFERRSE